MEEKILDPKHDLVLYELFTTRHDNEIAKHFLSLVFGKDMGDDFHLKIYKDIINDEINKNKNMIHIEVRYNGNYNHKIIITDYNSIPNEIGDYHTVMRIREKDKTAKLISEDLEVHVLEIPKIRNYEIPHDELAQWLKFIDNPVDVELERFMNQNKVLNRAKKYLIEISKDPYFRDLTERYTTKDFQDL